MRVVPQIVALGVVVVLVFELGRRLGLYGMAIGVGLAVAGGLVAAHQRSDSGAPDERRADDHRP